MAASAEERAALLAKIRADMEASRSKIQELKDQKASRGSIFVSATPTALGSGSNPSLNSLLTAPVDLTSNDKSTSPVNVSQDNSVLNSPKNNSNTTNVTINTPTLTHSSEIIPENPPDHVNEEIKIENKSDTNPIAAQTPIATETKQEQPSPAVTEPEKPKETVTTTTPTASVTSPSSPTTPSSPGPAEGFNKIFLVRKKDGTEEKILAKELPDGSLISSSGKILRVSTKERSASVAGEASPPILPKEKERSPSVAEGTPPELRANPGGRFLVKDRTNSIASRGERTNSIANRSERTPSVANNKERPPVDIGSGRWKSPALDAIKSQPEQKKDSPPTAPANNQSKPAAGGKNIRSLQDLQAAIQKADKVKQEAQELGKQGEIRRQTDEQKLQMTREEKKAYRQSKRMTIELQQNESRGKIENQISGFMTLMEKLELDWQKSEEDRIKREEEIIEQGNIIEKATTQIQFLLDSMSNLGTTMDDLKSSFDKLVDTAPKAIRKEDKWFGKDIKGFQDNFWDMHHQIIINTAKFKKMNPKEPPPPPPAGGAAPPPPPSSNPAPSTTPSANPFSSLLSQIRQGTSLRKLDAKEVEKERAQRKGNWRQSVQLLEGLQETLRDALDKRHLDLFSDSDSEEDEWDDEDDEYAD